jgi:hypothetical protein
MAMVVRNREEWERVRAAGQRRFLIRCGVIGRGLPMALLCALAIEISLGHPFPEALWSPPFLGRLVLAFAFFGLGGAFTTLMTWRLYERRFGPTSGSA